MSEQVLVESPGTNGILTLTMNRPRQRNALDLELRRALRERFERLTDDEATRVVVLRGAGGKAFASGGDLRELQQMGYEEAKEHFAEFDSSLSAIENCPIPVIAMIDGYAMGGGCELAAACDLRVASQVSVLGVPIGRIGHTLDKGNIRRLLRLMSPADLKALVMTDSSVTADEAQRLGLVNWVVPQLALESFTYAVAAKIAASAPLGVRALKRLVREVVGEPAAPSGDDGELAARLFATADFAEGVAAFFERRTPSFSGR